ncbi:TOM13-domain-containing protein [Patellaria atrata CBS 101060]|uniref:TOM13-domain-containing protein n=1 Tax=Patellaria atrata CBS 101060 TaxID=1346257 RepID=A0A9P4SH59_9PEZI|nr:TOM13-domain-containing protein [Patellaria atrata CBS 101060]
MTSHSHEHRQELSESGITMHSDSENYDGNNELSSSPPSSNTNSSPLILYSPPTLWGLLRGAAINLLLPFVNGLMLGFGELFAHEIAFRLGWSGTKVRRDERLSGRSAGIWIISNISNTFVTISKTFSSRSSQIPNFPSKPRISPLWPQQCLRRPQLGISRAIFSPRFQSTSQFRAAAASTPHELKAEPAVDASPLPDMDMMNLTGDNLKNIPEGIGYLKSLGLDYGWGPTSVIEWTLEHVHVLSGTPWWASIMLTTLLVRLFVFPLFVSASNNQARMQAVAPIAKPLQERMNEIRITGDMNQMFKVKAQLSTLYKDAGVSMFGVFRAPLVQGVLGFGTFRLCRGMANLPVPGLETGGLLWLTDLTRPDPYFLIPVLTSLVFHYLLKKGGESGVQTGVNPAMQKFMVYGLPVIMFVFSIFQPGCLQLVFFLAPFFGLIQSWILRTPSVRAFFGIAPLPQRRISIHFPEPFSRTRFEKISQAAATPNITISGMTQEVSRYFKSTMEKARNSSRMKKAELDREKARTDAYEKKRRREIEEERAMVAELSLEEKREGLEKMERKREQQRLEALKNWQKRGRVDLKRGKSKGVIGAEEKEIT